MKNQEWSVNMAVVYRNNIEAYFSNFMVFIFLLCKKINTTKRFGKKGWGLGKRTFPQKGFFPFPRYLSSMEGRL